MRALAHAAAVACVLAAAGDIHRARAQTMPAVRDLLDAYPARTVDFSSLKSERDFEQFRERFVRDAETWIRGDDPAERRRRELVAAAVGLELARAAFDVAWPQGRHLVEWGSILLRRRIRPDEEERLWHLAALPLMQGAFDYRLLVAQKDDVWLKRFPNEPRLLFALVVLLEGDTWPDPDRSKPWEGDEGSLEASHKMYQARRLNRSGVTADLRAKSFEYQRRTNMRQVMTLLEDLSNSIELRADALLRLGVLHLRLRHADVARDQFEDVLRLTNEPFLAFLAHLFNGAAHEQDGNRGDAVRAYRAALGAMPRAQSASFALATLLFLQDERAEAARLVDAAIEVPIADDPWRQYQSGDFRLWPQRIRALRKALER
jgi:tetratricopeptide (TPR) repeat protein